MKYRYRLNSYTTLTAVLAVTLLFSSCEDDRLDFPKTDSSEYICFASELTDITANVRTRSQSEHLLMESEDWPLEGTINNVTRVAPTTSFSGEAGVIAYKDAATSPVTELSDVSFTFDNEILTSTGTPIPWSKVSDASTLHVFSYAPYDVVHGVSSAATINTATASPTLSFTVPDAVGSQLDLIAASADVPSGSFRTSVPLTYNHVLTAIRFKVDFDCKVKSLTINGVNNTGTYTIGGGWSGQSGSQSYTFDSSVFGGSGTDVAANAFVTDEANTLMLIPQTVPEGATVVLTYDDDKTLTASIAGHTWVPGKRLTYTISKSGISYIYFDLAAGPVSITASDYSGYVYVNGTATNVAGTSPSDKKYYVYQSTTVTGSNDKDNTGYANSSDFDAKANIRLPSYSELISGGKTWSQFITDNSDIASVINGWTTATSGSRTGTDNRIHIVGNVTVDMTLDNVWCSYHENVQHRHTAGMLIGPTSASQGVRHEKVTLRLKGDNRFCNIYYFGHHPGDGSTANLHVTSAAGDGSYDGSLTVTVPSTDTVLEGACTVFGSGDNDDCPPCTDMYFDGGTIYVAGSILVKAGDSTGILGGGTNNHCDITINDANITAVAHSNGAAIGGGGGHSSGGGRGTVTINSGKVYAYQFGSYSGARYLSTAAIGGGSSYSSAGSAGNVTITGGEVYAQSVGGAAIGGGSSRDVNGGNANVTITGGYVIAKSIEGSINGHAVTVSNAIGGGKGGDGEVTGYGGSANLTISGGTLLSGSVGGGGTISATAPIGTATVNISGTAVVQGQFIMAAGASTAPTFTMTGGTLRKSTSGVFQIVKPDGGAVYIEDGTFTMSGGTIRGFSVRNGGAVYIENGSFEMSGGTIENCSATKGGAVYIKNTGSGAPSFLMSGSARIRDCISDDNGGGVYLEGGTVNITGGTIQENRSSASGGGVYVSDGSFTMSAGNILGNYAQTHGGGVAVSSSESASAPLEVYITGGNIQENWTYQRGGGISVVPYEGKSATVILGVANQGQTNPDISRNGASMSGGGVYVKKASGVGTTARLTINSGKIKDNIVSTLVDNPDVDNDGGLVTLNDGDVTHVVVTYHMNDGSIPETTATQKIVTSTRSVLNMPSWSITGYTVSWSDNPTSGLGTVYTNGQEVNLTTGLHIYAHWTPTP